MIHNLLVIFVYIHSARLPVITHLLVGLNIPRFLFAHLFKYNKYANSLGDSSGDVML